MDEAEGKPDAGDGAALLLVLLLLLLLLLLLATMLVLLALKDPSDADLARSDIWSIRAAAAPIR